MIPAWQIYFTIAWSCKTPLVFLLDKKYETITKTLMRQFYNWMPSLNYIPEKRDCDNFGFIYKGIADWTTNAVGLVIGRTSGWHLWNMALTKQGVEQIEPQNGKIVTKNKRYRA
ncbi:unnamed protein product [marine sediment metagenome]|uniref:Uncharacterized protein n=1 Tax=marine sediment metagenome TaxID=412755 RepID=X1MS25_9ZZZZ